MQQIVLLPKIYGQYQNRLLSIIKSDIDSLISELDVSIDYRVTRNNQLQASIMGEDDEFVQKNMVQLSLFLI